MWIIYSHSLFVLLIVFALSLDFNEAEDLPAVTPTSGFRTDCAFMVESPGVGSPYQYDPYGVMVEGNPTMKRTYNRFSTQEYSWVHYQKLEYWHSFNFFLGWIRLGADSNGKDHPCSWSSSEFRVYPIYQDGSFGYKAHRIGYGQIVNHLLGSTCIATRGTLNSGSRYDLPTYGDLKTAYNCGTWVRREKMKEGPAGARPTAVQVNSAGACTLMYAEWADYSESDNGTNYWCKLTAAYNGPFPGFHPNCALTVIDVIFGGNWGLDLNPRFAASKYQYMPFMRLHNGDGDWDPNKWARYHHGNLRFFHKEEGERKGKLALKLPMSVHFCIGPNENKRVIVGDSLGQRTA